MTWIKVCDGFDSDRRIEDVSLDAAGLFIRSASYSARYLLDGRIDAKWVRRRMPNARRRERLVAQLVEAGLWRALEDGGYEVIPLLHGDTDPLVNHFTKTEVEEKRRQEAERKREQRRRKQREDGITTGSVPEGHPGESPARPRSGRLGAEAGRADVGVGYAGHTPADPWALTDEERRDSRDADPFGPESMASDDEEAEIDRLRGKIGGNP